MGIIKDPAFFKLPGEEQKKLLEAFDWVEFTAPLSRDLPLWRIQKSGFSQVDTQIPFRIRFKDIGDIPGAKELDVCTAAQKALDVRDFMDFKYERFSRLGIAPARLNRRYELWSRNLIDANPDYCLQITYEDRVQGWCLSRPVGDKIDLTLAMMHKDAEIMGIQLYRKALCVYAEKGFRLCGASFSVTNTAVHNIYVRLGAQFLAPVGCWMRRGESRS